MYEDKNVPLLNIGIAWPSDKTIKFRNPPGDLKQGNNNPLMEFFFFF